MTHIVIFSHGFGVRQDDRGLFTDIVEHLPGVTPILFDYNRSDDQDNTLYASPFDQQVEKIQKVYRETRQAYPDATFDLIAHSQGCIIAAMAKLEGIRRTIFLTQPDNNFGRNIDAKIEDMLQRNMRPGTKVLADGSISYPRRDGSTTIIPTAYWESRRDVDALSYYRAFAQQTDLVIIQAKQDEVLGETDFSSLADLADVIAIDSDHDFQEHARKTLLELVHKSVLADKDE